MAGAPARVAAVVAAVAVGAVPEAPDAVAEVMDSTGMLSNTVTLVDKARAAGVTIMHAPITFAPGYGELTRHPYGILKGVVDGNAFVKGTWGAAIVDDLTPADGDIPADLLTPVLALTRSRPLAPVAV